MRQVLHGIGFVLPGVGIILLAAALVEWRDWTPSDFIQALGASTVGLFAYLTWQLSRGQDLRAQEAADERVFTLILEMRRELESWLEGQGDETEFSRNVATQHLPLAEKEFRTLAEAAATASPPVRGAVRSAYADFLTCAWHIRRADQLYYSRDNVALAIEKLKPLALCQGVLERLTATLPEPYRSHRFKPETVLDDMTTSS